MNARRCAVALAGLVALSMLVPGAIATAGADVQEADSITIDSEGDNVTVANGSAQAISGTVDLETGETIEVTVQSTGDTQPRFYRSKNVTVQPNGAWDAEFDFSDQFAGGTFNVTVDAGDATANATGEIVACDGGCAEPEPEEGITIDYEGEKVTVANGSTQVISGTASVPTGTEIRVVVQSTGDTSPRFYTNPTAVVTENGTWAVAYNFSLLDAGATFRVEASTEDGSYSATAQGEVIRCGESCADTPPTDTPTPIPEQTATETPSENDSSDDPRVTLAESAVDTVGGDVATIELQFDNTESAVVVVGSEAETGYELEALVRDADGDGSATLYLDTQLAGRDGDTVSVSSGDEVSVRSETDLETALAAGSYDLRVLADGQERYADAGTLFVSEAESTPTDSATPTDAPAGNDGMTGLLVSAIILLGGGGLALVLLRG